MEKENNTINNILFRMRSGMFKTDDDILNAYQIITNKMSTEQAEIRGADGLLFISLVKRVQDIYNKSPNLLLLFNKKKILVFKSTRTMFKFVGDFHPLIKTEPEEGIEMGHSSTISHTSTCDVQRNFELVKTEVISEESESFILGSVYQKITQFCYWVLQELSGFTDSPWTSLPEGLIELLNLIDDGLLEELDVEFTA